MDLFCFVIVLLHVSLATTADFSQVFKWQDELEYEWPSEASRTHALKVGTFKPSNFEPRYMAVSRTRVFLSLFRTVGISVTLVSLPTSGASSAPPKLTPFPSWDMHGYGDCNKIERARGLEMDSVGRLWVLDSGSEKCDVKLWIFDLFNNDRTKLVHRFTIQKWMHDLVLDETPNGYFAYIVRWEEEHIVVFSLERNQSWNVYTAGIKAFSIAVSPKSKAEQPRKLYLVRWDSTELYSIPVNALRIGTQFAKPYLIGKWAATDLYRMLMDKHGTMYAAFLYKNYISSWNTSQPFQEQRFHEVAGLRTFWPINFALDPSGTIWMMVFDKYGKPRYRLLKAAVDAKS